ncbi:MAG: DUF6512 family protein [bacterium]
MENKKIKIWEFWGVIFIFLFGALLHFAYDFSNSWKPLALISAVNESTWEHLKIAFWPAFIYSTIEFFVFGQKVKNFCFAKACSFLIIPIVIIVIFYSYTYFTGDNILFVDISTFFIAIAVAQLVGYKLMSLKKEYSFLNIIGIIIIIINLYCYAFFTYFPPKSKLFLDPVTGKYGIVEKIENVR